MRIFLDVITVITVISCAAHGRHRGAVRTLIMIIGSIAAFAAAVFVSNAAADYVYETYLREAVVSEIESRAEKIKEDHLSAEKFMDMLAENGIVLTEEQLKAIEENGKNYAEVLTDKEFRDTLKHMFIEYCRALTETFAGVLPEEIEEEADRYLSETDAEHTKLPELLTGAGSAEEKLTDTIEREIVKPAVMKTVKAALFCVTFAAVMIAAAIIAGIVGTVRKIPVLRVADGFFGWILGFLQGLFTMTVLCAAASVFIGITNGANRYLNTDVISDTFIFDKFYAGTFLLLSLILKLN